MLSLAIFPKMKEWDAEGDLVVFCEEPPFLFEGKRLASALQVTAVDSVQGMLHLAPILVIGLFHQEATIIESVNRTRLSCSRC